MLFERFLQWTAAAPAQARADAAQALIAAYGHVGSDQDRMERLDQMVATLLDDPCLTVRRALSEATARSVDVPRCILVALAGDDALVAAPVLAGSPLLSEADLVEAVATGDVDAQAAVANRTGVTVGVARALADIGSRDVVLILVRNPAANLEARVLRSILQRFGADAAVREALLDHVDLDPVLHHELMLASTDALTGFAIACGWMTPARAEGLRRDSHDKGVVTIAARSREAAGAAGPRALVAHLRAHGRLTPALLLRALLSGNLAFCEAALSHLSGLAPVRVAGHVREPRGLGFASLYAKAGLPGPLLPVFRAAFAATCSHDEEAFRLSRPAIGKVLKACLRAEAPELARVVALLRRLEAEAMRDGRRADFENEAEPARHPAALDLAVVRAALSGPPPALRAA